MRVLCLLNRDLASSLALNLLLPGLRGHDVLVGLSERVGSAASAVAEPAPRQELRIAEQTLPNAVLFPLIERAGLGDEDARRLTFQEVTTRRGIPVVPLSTPNQGAGLDTIRAFAPDLIVTIRYGAILKEPVLVIPRLGVLNLHSGRLPAYRGVLATFRALMNGDAEIGCTLHFIPDGSIDTGDVVGVRTLPVDPRRSLLWHILSLYTPGVGMISDSIARLARNEALVTEPQSAAGARYYTYPTESEWAEFLARGWRVADMSDLLDVLAPYSGSARAGSPA
jgi:methionyl-tRNA formyltransferase